MLLPIADSIMSWLQDTYPHVVVDSVRTERTVDSTTGRRFLPVISQIIYMIPNMTPAQLDSMGANLALGSRSAENCLVNGRIHFYKDGSGVNLTVWVRENMTSAWARSLNVEWCLADPDWLNQLEQHINHYYGAQP